MTFFDNLRTIVSSFDPDTISTSPFWDDEHISAQMLEAHLNPGHDAASRRPELRRKTLDWMNTVVPGLSHSALDIVDLGCGPGLYAIEWARAGHRVTAIDISRRSLAYAGERALGEGLTITYRNESYLALQDASVFDLATMLWCDLGALTQGQRTEVLGRILRALKPGGTLIFDVWGPGMVARNHAGRTWSWQEEGFWSPRPHLLLEERMHGAGVVARRILVCEEGSPPRVYHLRDYWFEDDALQTLLAAAGFEAVKIAGGVLGPADNDQGAVKFVSARKV